MVETIAVFIDGDNVSPRDMNYIMEEIKSYGRVVSSRLYTDWSAEDSRGWKRISHELALEPIQCDRISGKNSTDIKLTCVPLMWSRTESPPGSPPHLSFDTIKGEFFL